MKLVTASFNHHKVQEIQAFLAPFGVEIISLSTFTDQPPLEDGQSFMDNAISKARYGFEMSALATLADDSGLEVDALNGAPGVYSARFAGVAASDADNNRKLLSAMAAVPPDKRTARFRCAIALVRGEKLLTAQGCCEGVILDTPRGEGGFGYDPLFYLPEYKLTMAELREEHKNQISHRARALSQLIEGLLTRRWLN